jgi:ADP-ribosylglycohydrolase
MKNLALLFFLWSVIPSFHYDSFGQGTNKNPTPRFVINETEFRDKVFACWLGKNIGGTLGMPFEGKTDINNLTYYTNIKEGQPAANDDLDLQILWLKAMEENNYKVDAYTLGEYWLKYVPVDWNEYGIGKKNMKTGIMPPLSGEYNNAKWKNSNGAWIRSEIWACLAPGNPLMAAEMAWNDACVDHGCAEGTFAEIFTASLESAAFIEKDRDKLIKFGLSMIPENCEVSKAIKVALKSKNEGKTWQLAREDVIEATKNLGWFQAPRNVAFTMIGWLFGDDDFGKSICIAVNCGDDTDCTGATLGSIFGIIHGSSLIPDNWKKPIGDGIKTVAVKGFDIPPTLQDLTARTVDAQKKVADIYNSAVKINSTNTDIKGADRLLEVDQKKLSQIWNRSPYIISRHTDDLIFSCDYSSTPEILPENTNRTFTFTLANISSKQKNVSLSFTNLPANLTILNAPKKQIKISPFKTSDIQINFKIDGGEGDTRFIAKATDGDKSTDLQLVIIKKTVKK